MNGTYKTLYMRVLVGIGVFLFLFISEGHTSSSQRNDQLWQAISTGKKDVAKDVLRAYSDRDTIVQNVESVLMWAIKKQQLEAVQLLLELTDDMKLVLPQGGKALREAINQEDVNIVHAILDHKNSLNLHIENDCTPFERIVLEDNACTAFIDAVQRGQVEIAKLLLEDGIDANTEINSGNTLLLYATHRNDVEMVRLLLEYGANIDTQNEQGITAFFHAAVSGHTEIARLLLAHGADTTKFRELLKTNIRKLIQAAASGQADTVKFLIELGADLHVKDDNGNTLLRIAAEHKHLPLVKLLLQFGINVNATCDDGTTVLDWADTQGDIELVRILVEAGAK